MSFSDKDNVIFVDRSAEVSAPPEAVDSDRVTANRPAELLNNEQAVSHYLYGYIVSGAGIAGVPESAELPPIVSQLQESFKMAFPNDSFDDFVVSCSAEDIKAFGNLKSPRVVCDSSHPDQWTVIGTENIVSGDDFVTTKKALEDQGLELWNKELFMQEKIDGWTWLADGPVTQGFALDGDCKGERTAVRACHAQDSNPDRGGRGLRRVQKITS